MISLLLNMYSLKRAEKLAPELIAALQEKRFRKLLRHTIDHSPFYQTLYRKHGITHDNIDKVRLNELPIINKKMMMENYDSFVCDKKLKETELESFINNRAEFGKKFKDSYQVVHTSGTTGRIGIFAYSNSEWDLVKALAITRVTKAKINPFKKVKLAFIGATEGQFAGISLVKGAPHFLFDILPLNINDPLEEILEKIDVFKPDILTGYASGLGLLAKKQMEAEIDISPTKIISAAEPLTFQIRHAIKAVFGIEPTNFYAASEALCMAAECEKHLGLHLFTDWHQFEIVDEKNKPVNSGETGTLILTNLYNYTQPLIRYQMDDEITLMNETCSCGSPFPLIKSISGREEDFLWLEKRDGTKEYIHPLVIIETFVPGLEKFQVVQTGKNTLLFKAIIRGDKHEVIKKIHKSMNGLLAEKNLQDDVRFEIETVDNIPNNSRTGKYELVIPLNDI